MHERLISQLAHVELVSPTPQESVDFLVNVMGLEENGRDGESVYLRCWGDFFHHSVVVTEGAAPAMGHAGWRAQGPNQLETAVAQLEAAGVGEGWRDASMSSPPTCWKVRCLAAMTCISSRTCSTIGVKRS